MTELKYEKYIVTDVKPNLQLPPHRTASKEAAGDSSRKVTRLVWLDGDVVPGAFYSECIWFWPGVWSDTVRAEAHSHSFDEVIAFFGTNYDDPHDLCGEIELWLEDEQYVMTKSFLAYAPAGMKHCPLKIRRVDRPIFHFAAGLSTKYE